jgi:hypothetical protein
MDCIHRYHWCFSFGFSMSSFLSSYPMCALSWCLANFAYPFISISMWSFQCYNMAFFCYFIIGVCPFLHKVMRKATKRLTLQEEHTIKPLTLASYKCLELILDPTPLPSARLCRTQTLTHVREYVQTIHKLIPRHTYSPI